MEEMVYAGRPEGELIKRFQELCSEIKHLLSLPNERSRQGLDSLRKRRAQLKRELERFTLR